MDDAAQKQKINNGQVNGGQISNAVPAPVSSSSNKETGPVSEFVKPTEVKPLVESEVQQAGVEAISDKPKLDEIHEKIGVKLAPEVSEPNISASPNVTYPISDEEAEQILKENNKDLGIKEQQEGEYFTLSIVGIAALVHKLTQRVQGAIIGKK